MTMRTNHPVKCGCGHEGHVRMSESDTPYSANWESYTPVDLLGLKYEINGRFENWDKIFENMKLACPACKSPLTADNMN